jgi:hypothetical protein
VIGYSLTLPDVGRTTKQKKGTNKMKATTFCKYSAIVGAIFTFAMAWVNYWIMLIGFAIVGLALTAYLIAQDTEQ